MSTSIRCCRRRTTRVCHGLVIVALSKTMPKSQRSQYPFSGHGALLCLGEIRNMPGHCAVVDAGTNKVHVGFHCESFEAVPRGET